MTSERVCGIQPSERSPRTAAHQDGVGVVSHILMGDDCAIAEPPAQSRPASEIVPTSRVATCLLRGRIRCVVALLIFRFSSSFIDGGDAERHATLEREI